MGTVTNEDPKTQGENCVFMNCGTEAQEEDKRVWFNGNIQGKTQQGLLVQNFLGL